MNANMGMALCVLVAMSGCGSSTFEAQDADFVGFTSWAQTTAPRQGGGPSASVLGQAHSATDATITRSMYINNNANRGSDGQFPVGTILVKAHTKGGAMIGGTAMAKRGGDFNPGAKGWEWFVLSASGTIMVRGGADVMGGICNGCHTAAQNTDFVFTR
ncbi:MAG TPA: cytochrome P460 family protein [Pseudomonadota bacterium]|nr:cytochrome P460 family protein [Pseudomonadota bacterium]